jgi:Flp pilus assembly protein TadG
MPSSRYKAAKHSGTHRRGAAVVELAITVPFLALLAMGVVEYAQLTNAAQVVTNASRRGALYAAEHETASTTDVENFVREYVADSFENLSDSSATSAVGVSIENSAGTALTSSTLTAMGSGSAVVVDVSLDFSSIRMLSHFGILDNTTLQTSAVARRE